MAILKKSLNQKIIPIEQDFVDNMWERSWTYIKTVVDVANQPVLVLDKKMRIMSANKSFYSMFEASPDETISKTLFELGNKQWDLPELKVMLEEILPKNNFFKGFEVDLTFPKIGHKIFILNARQIHFKGDVASEKFPPIILLAMDDVTEIMVVAEKVSGHANKISTELTARAHKLDLHIVKLEKEISDLKNKATK